MKRCPECRRDYFDESLHFCLDDGAKLLEGPAKPADISFEPQGYTDEPATALIHSVADVSEAPTRRSLNSADSTSATSDISPPAPARVRTRRNFPLIAPVLGFALVTAAAIGAYLYYYARPSVQIESIAVMPFVNVSGGADVEYLSDGIAETLISSLAQLPNLTVKPRSSVFRYKSKNQDARTLGKELDVQAILTGSVVQRGSDIGLHIELVDAATDRVLWSKDYIRPLSNLIALQSEITREVSFELKTKLSGADERQLAKSFNVNPEAYQLYLKGRFHWNKRTKNDIYKAIDHYRQAVDLDPGYALAYTGLADAYLFLPGYDYSISRLETAAKARENAMKALSLDESLSEAHISVALIRQSIDHDFAGADREFKRAIQLDPNSAAGHAGLAFLAAAFGRMDEAEAYHKRALQLEPVSMTLNRNYGAFLQISRRYDESVEHLQRTIDLDPGFILAYLTIANTYQMQGKYSEAVDAYAKAQNVTGRNRQAALMRESYAQGGWKGFIAVLNESDWFEESRPRYVRATQAVTIGEKDKALAELERAYEDRESFIPLINVDPRLDPLRDDARFKALVRRVGIPQ